MSQQCIANTLLDQTMQWQLSDGSGGQVPLPLFSGWLRHANEHMLYLDAMQFGHDPVKVQLPAELARIVRRTHQVVVMDQVTARYVHGRQTNWEWRMPKGDGLPPRLISVTVSGAPLPAAGRPPGRGQVLSDLTFAEYIAKWRAEHDAARCSIASVKSLS